MHTEASRRAHCPDHGEHAAVRAGSNDCQSAKNSPSTPDNSVFRPFWACRAIFVALTPTSDRAGRKTSRTARRNMATLKPTTPLLTPNTQPLKPASPLRPQTAPQTPISPPHRRWRFQSHTDTSEQRRRWFQSHMGTSEQRRSRFQTTGPPDRQGMAAAPVGGGGAWLSCPRRKFAHRTQKHGDVETNNAIAHPQQGTTETSITSAPENCTTNTHFSPAQAMAVSIPHEHKRAKAITVSDNRPTSPSAHTRSTHGRRRGLTGRPVDGHCYKRRQTNAIQITTLELLLQTSSI